MSTKTKAGNKVRDSYLGLIKTFPLASIKSANQLKEAQEVIDALLKKGPLDEGEEMYLDALGDLVIRYEDEHYPISPASEADMLRHLMEAKGASQVDVARKTRIARSTISEILSGKRSLNKSHIRKLAKYFNVDPGVFIAGL